MLSHKQQHTSGNAWNAFQALYDKNLSPDEISPQQYIQQTVQPVYQTLIQKKGGEDSSTWRTFACNLIIEHGKIKGQFSKDVKTSACHIQKQSMKVFKTRLQDKVMAAAAVGIHCCSIIISGSSMEDPHALNSMICRTTPMVDYMHKLMPNGDVSLWTM